MSGTQNGDNVSLNARILQRNKCNEMSRLRKEHQNELTKDCIDAHSKVVRVEETPFSCKSFRIRRVVGTSTPRSPRHPSMLDNVYEVLYFLRLTSSRG